VQPNVFDIITLANFASLALFAVVIILSTYLGFNYLIFFPHQFVFGQWHFCFFFSIGVFRLNFQPHFQAIACCIL
jgi:hypothetical protein